MIDGKRILAVVPARGGSKRLPGKNIRMLCGKPLITWTIEAARKSRYIDKIYVSTDSVEIAEVARLAGLDVPELRPAELATDTASSIDVIMHTIKRVAALDLGEFNWVCLLQPTSPLRDEGDVDAALEQLAAEAQAQAIVAVCKAEVEHPLCLATLESGFLRPFLGTETATHIRRQDFPPVYFFEGSIYVSEIEVLRKKMTFYHNRTIAYAMPRWKSLDIDEICDLIMAEALLRAKMGGILSS